MNRDGENYVLEIEEQLADKRRMSLFRIIISSFIRNRTALLVIVIIMAFSIAAIFAPVIVSDPLKWILML